MSVAIFAASSASKRASQIHGQENGSCCFLLKALIIAAFALLFFTGFNSTLEPLHVEIAHRPSQDSGQDSGPFCYEGGYHLIPTPTALPSWDPQTLIDNVKARKWSFDLDPYPMTPLRHNCIDSREVARFDALTGDKPYNAPIKRLLNHTLTVSHPEFQAMLSYAAKNFTDYLLGLATLQRDYILVFPNVTKSERWVAELLLRYLPLLPLDVTLMNHLPVSLKKYPHVKRIVMADDAAYSCVSMAVNLATVTFCPSRPFIIHAIIPFMRSRDCLNEVFKGLQADADMPKPSEIMVHTALEFGNKLATTTIFQNLDSLSTAWLRTTDLLSEKLERYALAFDHKLPDAASVPRAFYQFLDPENRYYSFLADPYPPYKSDRGQSTAGKKELDVRMQIGNALAKLVG